MRTFKFILILLLFSSFIVKGQGSVKNDTLIRIYSKQIEFKLGFGKLQPQLMVFDFNYILPVYKSISAIYFSQIDISAWDRNPDKIALVTNQFHLLQLAGIGASVGKRVNIGGYYLIGGRYYHSHTIEKDLYKSELYLNKVNFETGLLLNIKIGKKKYYFATQLYFPVTPISKPILEKNPTLTIGLGLRLNR
jgi:hypothetical protein